MDKLDIYMVKDEMDTVRCIHPPKMVPIDPDHIYSRPQRQLYIVRLEWSLQMDGTYRKLGQCSCCGRIYVTDEIRRFGQVVQEDREEE